MTIRELLSQNKNLCSMTAAYLNVIAHHQSGEVFDIVNANHFCEDGKRLLDAEIESWYLCFDQHDIDVIELRINLK